VLLAFALSYAQVSIPVGFSARMLLTASVDTTPFANNSVIDIVSLANWTVLADAKQGFSVTLMPDGSTGDHDTSFVVFANGTSVFSCYDGQCCATTFLSSAFGTHKRAAAKRDVAQQPCVLPPSSSCSCGVFSPLASFMQWAPLAQPTTTPCGQNKGVWWSTSMNERGALVTISYCMAPGNAFPIAMMLFESVVNQFLRVDVQSVDLSCPSSQVFSIPRHTVCVYGN